MKEEISLELAELGNLNPKHEPTKQETTGAGIDTTLMKPYEYTEFERRDRRN